MLRDGGWSRCGDQRGQASVALIAIVPALILVALTMVQFALAGHAALSAVAAARAAARASYAGTDVEDAARLMEGAPGGAFDGSVTPPRCGWTRNSPATGILSTA